MEGASDQASGRCRHSRAFALAVTRCACQGRPTKKLNPMQPSWLPSSEKAYLGIQRTTTPSPDSMLSSFTRARTIDTQYSSIPYSSQRDNRPFFKAMCISTFITLATFLPLLFRLGLTSPIPQNGAVHTLAQVNYPDPGPSSGNISWIHDPSIIYEGGKYWRFSTSGNIAVATAPSISGPWTYEGALLREGTKIHVADGQDIWASRCFHSSAEQH